MLWDYPVGCSGVCHHANNGIIHRIMVVECPLVITTKVKLFFRPDKTRKKDEMVLLVICIVDAGSFYEIHTFGEVEDDVT